jgi:hypothetical protein
MFGLLALAIIAGLQGVGPSEYRRRLKEQLVPYITQASITFTGTTTAASPNITAATNLNNLRVGMSVTGPGIPINTHIDQIQLSAATVVLSQNASAPGSGVTFTSAVITSTAKCHLYAAPYAGSNDPTPASFVEATFDTYLPLPLSGTQIYSNPDGSAESDFGDLSWVLVANPTTANTIYGYWIDYVDPNDGVTVVVSTWESFPTPMPMSAIGNAVILSVPLTAPNPSSAFVQ